MLHALTDSLWIRKDGATGEELSRLCETITRETGIEMSLEGVYRWLIFLPSKIKSTRPVAARFYGVFADGGNVHPGEKIGYVITNAKAKNKAERVSTSNRNGLVQYDRQEYAARLKVAAKEVGVIDDDDLSDERGGAGANRLPLFPD